MDGFLNINKPIGITSAEVVRVIKRELKTKKIGYIGTLDPIAEGVLVVALGRATRLIPFLERQDKEYDTTLTLGAETDTQDRTGAVVNQADPSAVTAEDFMSAAEKYVGEIEQTPPMYSAKKVDGQRLYDLARQGVEVERKPVKTTIYSLRFMEKNGPEIRFSARVATGTYLRTLCHDIGRALGVYGHLSRLTRTRAGIFTVESALPLDTITRANFDEVRARLISLADGLGHLARAVILPHSADRLKNGIALGVSDVVRFDQGEDNSNARLVNKDGWLYGVGTLEGPPLAGFPFSTIKPKRVLN
ncbi:MAG: tRNA pseudouridine(55) synthase TruB [Nitrospinae bacterium]|nr:tRNA pseudouridine(55) synthase TruB [Nitrospinota bacterium]